jgi:hypothetical protein
MVLFNYYIDDVKDRVWFDSSNIVYAECLESDTQYKTVIVVFKDGRRYKYNDVFVYDWRGFKESESQGKSLNTYIAKKEASYEKIDSIDVEELKEELSFRQSEGLFIQVKDCKITLLDNKDNQLYQMDSIEGYQIENNFKEMLEALGKLVKVVYSDK